MTKRCPDLVIWDLKSQLLRLVAGKNPRWDKPTQGQVLFMRSADSIGIPTKIVEWEFGMRWVLQGGVPQILQIRQKLREVHERLS